LYIEYDPRPPFDAGHPSKASKPVLDKAKKLGRKIAVNPSEVRAMPTIAWRRVLDRIRSKRASSRSTGAPPVRWNRSGTPTGQ
jgi:hypothetical protein